MNANNVKKVLSKNILADGFDPIIDLKKSHDSWLVDERDGSEYLDMFSMYASGAIGYNHPEIIKNKDLIHEVSLFKPTLSDIYSTHYADFMDTFDKIAIPGYLKNAFFIEGGSLAVENALKAAFDWKIRKNLENGLDVDEDMKIIHFKQAFHGRSGYTLSLTNTSDPRKTMYFPKFDWPRIDNPYLSYPINDDVIESVKPNVFIFENVIGLKSAKLPELGDDGRAKTDENGKPKKSKEKVIDSLTEKFRELGYDDVEVWTLNAADYGVPQRRKRVFIVGNKLGMKFGTPPETHSERGSESTIKWVSSFDAISDLGSPTEDGAVAYEKDPDCVYQRMMRNGAKNTTLHFTPYASPSEKEIIPFIKQGGNYEDVPDEVSTKRIMGFKKSGGRTTTYGRLHPEKPTYTLNTHFNRINIGANIHYDEDRIITIREGLRFQSFPDSFDIISSTKRNYYLQVGNAVPPLLAQAIAKKIRSGISMSSSV